MSKILGILLVVLSIVLGAFQERVKININSNLSLINRVQNYDNLSASERKKHIENLNQNTPYNYYENHEKLEWLYQFDSSALYSLKWAVTILLILAHFLLGFFIVKYLIAAKKGVLMTFLVIYLAGFTLALVSFGVGKLIGFDFYPFSRRIVGALQSIIPVVFVFFIIKFNTYALK